MFNSKRGRKLVVPAAVLAVVTAVVIVGFGSLASARTGSSGLTADQKACVKNALGSLVPAAGSSVTVPTQEQVQNDIAKFKDAMKTCGITLPAGVGRGGTGSLGLTAEQKACVKNALGSLVPAAGSSVTVPTQGQIQNDIAKFKDAMKACGVTSPTGGSGMI
jgi:hypothetical protein